MTEVQDPPKSPDHSTYAKLRKAGSLVRRQIGSVTSAIGIFVLLHRIFTFDLRGIIADLVSVWDAYIGQATGWLIRWLIEAPLSLLGLNLQVPVFLRDYISVGIIVCLSVTRAMSDVRRRPTAGKTSWKGILLLIAGTLGIWIAWILVWPITLLSAALMGIPAVHRRVSTLTKPRMLRAHEELPPSRTGWLVFAPLLYVAFLLLAAALLR